MPPCLCRHSDARHPELPGEDDDRQPCLDCECPDYEPWLVDAANPLGRPIDYPPRRVQ